MTHEEALVALHALEGLQEHPGWRLAAARWEESEREYDAALHRDRVDDVVRMQTCQTTCRVLRQVLNTPQRMIAELMEIVKN